MLQCGAKFVHRLLALSDYSKISIYQSRHGYLWITSYYAAANNSDYFTLTDPSRIQNEFDGIILK